MDVEEERPGGVRDIGRVHGTAREAKEQEAVDRPEAELPALGAAAGVREVSEQPGELGGAEIGVEEEAGLVPDHGLARAPPPAGARSGRGAAVLADDGVRERPPAVPLPEEGRLPLTAFHRVPVRPSRLFK